MTNLKKLGGVSVIIAALLAGPAVAQDMGYDDWDADGDGALSEDEFMTGFGEVGAYDSWDEDGDGSLTEDEFNAGIFDSYDDDDSGVIEEPEFGDANDDMGDEGFWDI